MFILPGKLIQLIKTYCRTYVWTSTNTINKKALIAWNIVCSPKAAGKFNITDLLLWNKTTIAKLYWDLSHKQDRLWIIWVHDYLSRLKITPE